MSTRIETADPHNGVTVNLQTVENETLIIISQEKSEGGLVLDMETARKLGFVLQGATDQWRRDNPSGGRIHASNE